MTILRAPVRRTACKTWLENHGVSVVGLAGIIGLSARHTSNLINGWLPTRVPVYGPRIVEALRGLGFEDVTLEDLFPEAEDGQS